VDDNPVTEMPGNRAREDNPLDVSADVSSSRDRGVGDATDVVFDHRPFVESSDPCADQIHELLVRPLVGVPPAKAREERNGDRP
jgi:hypothetical protein